MKLASLSLVLLAAAACGGSSKPAPTSGPTGPAARPGVPAAWADVLVEGATFRLGPDHGTEPPDPERIAEDGDGVVTLRVHDVTTKGDVTRAVLTPVEDLFSKRVQAIQVSPAGVWFSIYGQDDDDDAVFAGPPTFPAGAEKTLRDGDYDFMRAGDAGTVCYGWEPGPDAEECEEVCGADFCVAPGKGIVSGSGTWWPNYEPYIRVEK